MKKLRVCLCMVTVIVSCLLGLTGCNTENDSKNIDNLNNSEIVDPNERIEEIIGEASIDESEIVNTTSGDASGDIMANIGLYSTDNRAVFNFGNVYYLVYDFNGEEVSDLNYYYEYEDEETAKYSYEYFKIALENNEINSEEIDEIKQEGKYVIVKVKESMYADTTKEEVMEAYSYFEQIYDESSTTSGE